MDYIRMLYIAYGSVYELEMQILLAGDLDLIAKDLLGTLKKEIAESQRMLKALIKSLENKLWDPCPLESWDPLLQLNWRRFVNRNWKFGLHAFVVLMKAFNWGPGFHLLLCILSRLT